MIIMIRPWRTGGRIVDNILLSGFGINFILIYYISLFESRYDLRARCVARVKQLKDLLYHEEQCQQRKKIEEEEERLAREAKQ
jgi:hypothetical protein